VLLLRGRRCEPKCPPLFAEAFVAERLDAQLDEQARAWLADPERNRYDRAESEVRVSAIFAWFEGDFERDAGSVQAWIARYAPRRKPVGSERPRTSTSSTSTTRGS